MIRPATTDDIPFMLRLARARYNRPFDDKQASAFLARAIRDPEMCVLVSERGAALGAITQSFWDAPRAYLMFIVAFPGRGMIGEGVALVRAVNRWRCERGAESLHFGEDTGLNFAPLARRVGAEVDRPTYVLRGGAKAQPEARPGTTLLDRMLGYPGLMGSAPLLKLVETG
jgi:hypothetical protein